MSDWPGSMLVVHGALDWLVLPNQSCNLASKVGQFTSFRIRASNATSTTPPTRCKATGLIWAGGELPRGNWGGKRYLLVYDNFGHGNGEQSNLALLDALNYLGDKFPAN